MGKIRSKQRRPTHSQTIPEIEKFEKILRSSSTVLADVNIVRGRSTHLRHAKTCRVDINSLNQWGLRIECGSPSGWQDILLQSLPQDTDLPLLVAQIIDAF